MQDVGSDTPRCLVCDVELEVPAGGGRVPRFCSGAHRARYNRDQRQRPLSHPSLVPAVSVPVVEEFELSLATTAAAGRRLVAAAAASHKLSVELAGLTARADQAEAAREAADHTNAALHGHLESLQAAVQALRAQLAIEEQLREQITAERDRLATQVI